MKKHSYYQISQKSRYSLWALLELALLGSDEPIGVKKLSEAQGIPTRFLEVILNELKQGGFVDSVRGKNGGYLLARSPREITAGEIIRFVESVKKEPKPTGEDGPVKSGDSAEAWLFGQVNDAISDILDKVSLEDMVQQEMKKQGAYGSNYVI